MPLKAFSSKRGLFFTVKGPRALAKFHTEPRGTAPPLIGGGGYRRSQSGVSQRGRGGGAGEGGGWCPLSVWNLGSARGPFTVKKRPLFDENAFLNNTKLLNLECNDFEIVW